MRYKPRHYFAMVALLAVPTLTCGVGPVVLDLLERVEALEAESDAQLVLVDANGAQVGSQVHLTPAISGPHPGALAVFEVEGIAPFVVEVHRDRLEANTSNLFFESADCTGPAFVYRGTSLLPFVFVRHPESAPINPILVEDTGAELQLVVSESRRTPDGQCLSSSGERTLLPALDTSLEFLPPFELRTRSEFLAMTADGG